jgi:uncharacterized membrane protein YgcG
MTAASSASESAPLLLHEQHNPSQDDDDSSNGTTAIAVVTADIVVTLAFLAGILLMLCDNASRAVPFVSVLVVGYVMYCGGRSKPQIDYCHVATTLVKHDKESNSNVESQVGQAKIDAMHGAFTMLSEQGDTLNQALHDEECGKSASIVG